MIDFAGICDALAARFEAATLGTPTGAPPIAATFGQMPKAAPALPAVVIVPQDGQVVAQSSAWQHEMRLDAVLVLARRSGDPARVESERQAYLPYLLAATEGQLQLGLGSQPGWGVVKALPTGWDWAEWDMAGDGFDALRVHFQVWVGENVSLRP